MQFSLKNTSIRIQVLLPVFFTALALLISLWYTSYSLDKEQKILHDNTTSFIFYKDQLAKIDDHMYPMRINAVYAIYDHSRRVSFLKSLDKNEKILNELLLEISEHKTFGSDANVVKKSVHDYLEFSKKVLAYQEQKEQGLTVDNNYSSLIA
ncbi:methyl-accepting chemotaxis protein, partial [Aliivibrio sifiae]